MNRPDYRPVLRPKFRALINFVLIIAMAVSLSITVSDFVEGKELRRQLEAKRDEISRVVDDRALDDIVVTPEDIRSEAADRVVTPGGLNLMISPGSAAMVRYDAVSARWRVVALTTLFTDSEFSTGPIAGVWNDFAPIAPLHAWNQSIIRITTYGPTTITGLADGVDGLMLVLLNAGHVEPPRRSGPVTDCGGLGSEVTGSDSAFILHTGPHPRSCTVAFSSAYSTVPSCIVSPKNVDDMSGIEYWTASPLTLEIVHLKPDTDYHVVCYSP